MIYCNCFRAVRPASYLLNKLPFQFLKLKHYKCIVYKVNNINEAKRYTAGTTTRMATVSAGSKKDDNVMLLILASKIY